MFPDVPTTFELKVSPENVTSGENVQDPTVKYVYLRARSQSAGLPIDEGTRLLLSYKAGYTFVQTDKPIYTPNQEGKSDFHYLATRQTSP